MQLIINVCRGKNLLLKNGLWNDCPKMKNIKSNKMRSGMAAGESVKKSSCIMKLDPA